MSEYRLTNKAVEDLNAIWVYTFDNWSEEQADKYYHVLLGFCQNIADKPDLGKNYEGIRPDLFGLVVNRHIIFYRKITTDLIEITRILHSRMDLKNRITE
ncbi:type II toxin-antitoxin system RelE/ParE family toxin [Marivirga sp.]|uniref:type II toxin-antitoxin system RelE/ParE family toxin n=1 Tax=Marivirga sp. TaxID=2018662 RepID=UPI002D7E54B2|nr:type II toxin-antitoxin system RelE/ParE family toxin [Marivirga sp.]HET8861375.1 type II toxin-antitoxin system RelE/ParE family toxin [Marivirga sp.]